MHYECTKCTNTMSRVISGGKKSRNVLRAGSLNVLNRNCCLGNVTDDEVDLTHIVESHFMHLLATFLLRRVVSRSGATVRARHMHVV